MSILDYSLVRAAGGAAPTAAEEPTPEAAFLETVLADARIGFAFIDSDGRFVRVNERLARRHGLPAEAHAGLPVGDVVGPAEWAILEPLFLRALLGEAFPDVALAGEPAVAALHPVRVDGGRVGGVALIVREAAEQRTEPAALAAGEARFRTILENLNDAVSVSARGAHVYCNPAYCALFGYGRDTDLIGVPIAALIAPEERDRIRERARRRAEGQPEPTEYETKGLRKDGSVFDYEIRIATYAIEGEVFTVVIARDVSEKKRNEAALRETGERYRLLFDSNPHPMWVHDRETLAILAVNEAAVRHYGYTREAFLTMTLADIRPPEDVPALRAVVASHDQDAFDGPRAWKHRKKNGQVIDVEVTSNALTFAGRPARVVMSFDVTERLRAERALQESEARFREVLERIQLVAVILDTEGKIQFCNDFLLRLTGWQRDEVLGRDWFDTFLPPERRDAVRAEFLQAMQQSTLWLHRENVIRTRAGERRLISWNNTLLHDAGGGILGSTSIGEDITERRRLEEQQAATYAQEKRIAETLQRAILEKPPLEASPHLEVETFYQVAGDEAMVGGDFYDAFALEAGKVALVVGDASGKGLRAAARTAEVKYALRAFLREYPHPAQALLRMNAVLCEALRLDHRDDGGTFVVLSVAVVDPANGSTVVASAGAEPPFLLRANGAVEEFTAGGLPLGVEAGEAYHEATLHLAPADLILMATDGIMEARRGQDMLDTTGVVRLAREARALPSLDATGRAILDGARAFAGGPLPDDACLLLARRR